MIKKLKIGLFTIGVLMLVFMGVNSAYAAALTWSADTTVTINSNNYTIKSGSAATSLVVNATTLVVVIPTNETFTLVSLDRYPLNNDLGITTQCDASQNLLLVSGGNDGKTITITPSSASTCVYDTGGSRGGGSSNSSTTTTTTTTTTITTPVVVPTVVEGCLAGYKFSPLSGKACPVTSEVAGVSSNTPITTSVTKFTSVINKNSVTSVKNLQTALNESLGMALSNKLVVDGKWGKKTTAAIKQFQQAKELTVDGIVGPKTRSALNTALGL